MPWGHRATCVCLVFYLYSFSGECFARGEGLEGGQSPLSGEAPTQATSQSERVGERGRSAPSLISPGREAGWAGKSTSARKLKEDGFLNLHASSGAPSSGCRRCAGYVCPFSAPVSDLCPHIRHGRRAGAGKVHGEMEAEGEMLRGTFMLPRLRTVSPTYKRR